MIKFSGDPEHNLDLGILTDFFIIALISNIGGIGNWWGLCCQSVILGYEI